MPLPNEEVLFNKNVKRSLCIQPVRIKNGNKQTGAGLKFLQPEADTQWDKVNIVFDFKGWKNVNDARFFCD